MALSLANQTLSLYVPRVADGTTPDFVAAFMRDAGYGQVSRVDINPLSGTPGKAEMFVHFAAWFDTPVSQALHQTLSAGQSTRVYPHGDDTYWCLNRAHTPMSHTERRLEDRIAQLEEMVEMQAQHFDEELDRRDQVIEQLLARVLTLDDPADYAPGERSQAELDRLYDIDPLRCLPEKESDLPLAPNELEWRAKYDQPHLARPTSGKTKKSRRSGKKARK